MNEAKKPQHLDCGISIPVTPGGIRWFQTWWSHVWSSFIPFVAGSVYHIKVLWILLIFFSGNPSTCKTTSLNWDIGAWSLSKVNSIGWRYRHGRFHVAQSQFILLKDTTYINDTVRWCIVALPDLKELIIAFHWSNLGVINGNLTL